MTRLTKNKLAIDVPADAVDSYVAEGWVDVSAPVEVPVKAKRKRASNVRPRANSRAGAQKASSEPGKPEQDDHGSVG
jgi:hypothetical protein